MEIKISRAGDELRPVDALTLTLELSTFFSCLKFIYFVNLKYARISWFTLRDHNLIGLNEIN